MLEMILASIPAIFGALLVLAVSYAIGKVVAGLVSNLLSGVGFDRVLEKLGLGRAAEGEEGTSPSSVVGSIVLTLIMLFAAVEAANLLGFDSVEGLMTDILGVAGHVLFGVVIFGLGLYLANFVAGAIRGAGAPNASVLATAARAAILLLSGAMALRQMGIANEIIELAFGLIVGAVAVAAAIAFGIGGRDIAAQQLVQWSGSLNRRSE